MNRMPVIALSAAAMLANSKAHADCKPLLDALEQASMQARFAGYDVDGAEQAQRSEPDVVVIGTASYVRSGAKWERVEIGELGGHWADSRKRVAAGELGCNAAGSARHRGASGTKLDVIRHRASKQPSQIYIDQCRGLPVCEGEQDSCGIAVLYGSAVKKPLR